MNNKKKYLLIIRITLYGLLIFSSIVSGIIFYYLFLSYYPGINWNEFFISKFKISLFEFSGIFASIFVSLPILIISFEIFYRNSTSYLIGVSDKAGVFFSETAIKNFSENSILSFNGVENVEVKVDILKHNFLGLNVYIELSEKTDFTKFAERISERLRQDLEFNFGTKKIKFLNIYIENLINQSEQSYIVIYK